MLSDDVIDVLTRLDAAGIHVRRVDVARIEGELREFRRVDTARTQDVDALRSRIQHS